MIDKCVSIIIPVYNTNTYFDKCIKSVLNQSYQNIEIILVDDGSNDGVEKKCDRYSKVDSRIITIHQKNQGPSIARNNGIKKASGEYITFIDSDDWIDIDCIENVYNCFNKFDCDIVAFSCIYEKNGISKKIEPNFIENRKFDLNIYRKEFCAASIIPPYNYKSLFPYEMHCGPTMYSTCCKVYKMSFLLENTILFDESIKVDEDRIFGLKASLNAKNIYFLNKPYYHYIERSGSLGHEDVKILSNNYIKGISKLEEVAKQTIYYDFLSKYLLIDKVATTITIFKRCSIKYMEQKNIKDIKKIYHNFIENICLDEKDISIDKVYNIKDKIMVFFLENSMFLVAINICTIFYRIKELKLKYKDEKK